MCVPWDQLHYCNNSCVHFPVILFCVTVFFFCSALSFSHDRVCDFLQHSFLRYFLYLSLFGDTFYSVVFWYSVILFDFFSRTSVSLCTVSGVNSGASWWGVNREWTAAQINYTTKEFGRNHISADENDGFFSYILLWKVSRVQLACCIYTITIHCIQVYNLNIWVQVCTDKLHTWTEHLISVIFRKTGKENGSSGNTEHVLTENGNKNKIK